MKIDALGMLCAGTSNLDRLSGGQRSTFPEEVRAVLGLVSRQAADFAMLKYTQCATLNEILACSVAAQDKTYLPENLEVVRRVRVLNRVMLVNAARLSREHKWRPRDIKMLLRMSELALAESLAPPVCRQCKGEGGAMVQGRHVQCQRCRGIGSCGLKECEYKDLLDIDRKGFARRWQARYGLMLGVCQAWEDEVRHAMRREGFVDDALVLAVGK